MAGYRYDVFISYARRGNVPDWVQNHFKPMLERCLDDELGRAEVFLDATMESGTRWLPELRDALLCSRVLVPVLSAQYFLSSWCIAELQSFLLRETGREVNQTLVMPVRFADCEP